MNKRGIDWMSEEVLRMVIAAICLAGLFLLLYGIYNANKDAKNIDLAKNSLQDIVNKIANKEEQIRVTNVKGWAISSWPDRGNIPSECTKNNWNSCICICALPSGSVKTFLLACNTLGTCLENNFAVKGFDAYGLKTNIIEINPAPMILVVNYSEKSMAKATELDFARSSLNSLVDDINQGRTQNSQSINPVGWQIASFPQEIPWLFSKKTVIPQSCSYRWTKCICIFKNDNIPWTNIADEANKGLCVESPASFTVNGVILIKDNLIVTLYPKIIAEKKSG